MSVLLTLLLLLRQDPTPAPTPTNAYQTRVIQGWTARVHPDLLAEERLAAAVLELLEHQLFQVRRALPEAAVARLQQVPIWVERAGRGVACMCYHVSADWLRAHGYNPDKAGGIEIGNAENFLAWSHEQPWMTLHELAHAWYWRELGGHDEAIARAHATAAAGGAYQAVLHANGRTERHYALTNPDEYFAELSEACFGLNDFYPFVRAELAQVDPEGLAAVRAAWAR